MPITVPAAAPALEFALHPDDLAALGRHPGVSRTARPVPVTTIWHDSPDGALASRGMALSEERGRWRLASLAPQPGRPWPPGAPAPLIAEANSPEALSHILPNHTLPNHTLPSHIVPVAALHGRRLACSLVIGDAPPAAFTVLHGSLRSVSMDKPIARLMLTDANAAMALAGAVRLTVPLAGVADTATSLSCGRSPAGRITVALGVALKQTVSDSAAAIIGQLVDQLVHWSDAAAIGANPVPVHQMRVATRRLRSAFAVFRTIICCPELMALEPAVRDTATRLGAARDWDVFLGGVGADIAAAFPDDRRVRGLLAAARRRRADAYAALRGHLEGAAFRQMTIGLACAATLRPWGSQSAPDPQLSGDIAPFALAALDAQARRVRHGGRGLAALPTEALHDLRKRCKRLRYAAEFFRPLFPARDARRYVKRLAALQEVLGRLNDAGGAAALLAQLGRMERGYAAGLVGGFVVAGAAPSRAAIGGAWSHFRRAPAFWR